MKRPHSAKAKMSSVRIYGRGCAHGKGNKGTIDNLVQRLLFVLFFSPAKDRWMTWGLLWCNGGGRPARGCEEKG